MFQPKFIVTNQLLANIKRISEVVTSLNERRFPQVVLLDLEKEAREISSFASTSIEGNPLPLTDVKRLLKSAPAQMRDTEREVINYNTALTELKKNHAAEQAILNEGLILKIHHWVMDQLLPSGLCGKFRKDAVFVNDPRSRTTVFWPADHQDVSKLMNELLVFIKHEQGTIDPLILAGLFHKQFIMIHPFMDGNGRTVRLATKVLLAALGLDTFNLFSFERYYNANVTKYFAMVGERGNYYDLQINFTPWLEYFTGGILDELLRVQKELEQAVISPGSGLKAHHRIILDYLKEHGSITDAIYATLTSRAKPTRALDFRYLLDQGLIDRHGIGRSTYYRSKSDHV